MASLKDGLGGEELASSGLQANPQSGVQFGPYFLGSITSESQISGANIYSTGDFIGENVYGDTMVSGATVKATTVSGGTFHQSSKGTLQSVSIGSGTASYGAFIQAGSGALSSGSTAWIEYPVSYSGKPTVLTQNYSSFTGIKVNVGSINAGSFYAEGETASDEFGWESIGI